jgi:6-phosphogluconolactonase
MVFQDASQLTSAAADLVLDRATRAVAATGVFRIALAGGGTPRALYATLAGERRYQPLPWNRTDVFWGDERHVGPEDPESNYRLAWQTLLNRVPVDPARLHRIRAEDPDATRAATQYERTLQLVFGLAPGSWPRFDLVLLGVGADGHTASLFPGSPALLERSRSVVAPWIDRLRAFRITMTLPVFNHAAHVMFLAAGADKGPAVAATVDPPPAAEPPPAALVKPTDGELTWMLDRQAARFLSSA